MRQNRSIIYSLSDWSKLHLYLSENQRFEDSVDRKRQEWANTREKSKQLKETFVGSKDEEKLKLKLQRDKEKYEKELKKNQEQRKRENLKIIEQTKLALKKNKDGWKALDSALRLADTLRERRKQLEFQEKIKQVEKDIEKKYADKIFQNAQEFQEEKLREKQEKFLRKNENFERATKSLQELWAERDRLRKIQIKEEIEEVARVKSEIKAIENAEKQKKEETKKIVEKITQESFELEMRKKEKEKIEEELDKATLHVIKQTTLEITNVKNKLMQERHNAEAEKRNRIQQHLASIMRAEENNEEERLKNDLAKAEQRQILEGVLISPKQGCSSLL
uniref:Trichohyalin-plectin-homology domain-containing protein n=1 Tax=Cacopsylla melanoneura TaxID=428564 RepID=A0A8D8X0E2_9HEMI